ncbi:hypothetical protein KP509_02G052800 [Ceratopteris richardii]|uniref:Methyltransferase n=1 Tax=Ceratopteris richardii TaxID=49495 RepID=A0A8T2VCX9_CERRI|nr:hypothetical protein KP509_02G052800 [Ceratopteris richardii]KAH7443843.1 hypothetical protein KP509_02G052800 [Ceratopteris richardii]KAH7443844.1 hypothetical protein KP509_02G052800 [Ceratopteris richardii]KAH7443845.1 hypothetical protein KP509_02G052800 [Ceratopteris richardii]KAH7443846.1 hypothetical protein KP509_02G052800 [Ceratopteris richardii]
MALSKFIQGEKHVRHYWIVGAVLGFFLLCLWLLFPSSEVVSKEASLSVEEESPIYTNHDTTKRNAHFDDKEYQDTGSNFETEQRKENLSPGPPKYNDTLAHEDLEHEREDEQGVEETESRSSEPFVEEDKFENNENDYMNKNGTVNEDSSPTAAAESELNIENQEKPNSWSTQIIESREEISLSTQEGNDELEVAPSLSNTQMEALKEDNKSVPVYKWEKCGWDSAMDYIPCLDNKEAIKRLPSRRRFQHRERHCPAADRFPMCLVPLPKGYKVPIRWPRSRSEIWLDNVPHIKLVSYKKDQNWVKLIGDKLIFPGGGTQFKDGALEYVKSIESYVPSISWGKHTRVVLDIGCGVASFGGFLFDKDVITMSFAPKDEHEAQIQLALERGIPAISAVMGTQRLPFPSNAFDLVHCARCRIHWFGDDGKWLLEVDRILRPGGYFVWSATPVYRMHKEDVDFWEAMVALTESMCWNLTAKTMQLSSGPGMAVYQKPTANVCYEKRYTNVPPMCNEEENPDAAWYTPLGSCLHWVPTNSEVHRADWPPLWPDRIDAIPLWLNSSDKSIFGKPAANEFQTDAEHWRRILSKSYLTGLGIDWAGIRNVMDMNAGYGGFAAALLGVPVWVMNVVPVDGPDTLPVIFDRGLIGIYHDWCESFSTYPRTYDLLHADHVFKHLFSRCKPVLTLLEMDRILRPQGWVIMRETSNVIDQLLPVVDSLHWKVQVDYEDAGEHLLVLQKTFWRPDFTDLESK